MTNTTCKETEIPGFGTVPGCGRTLTLHYYINKDGETDAIIVCPHCDLVHRWPEGIK